VTDTKYLFQLIAVAVAVAAAPAIAFAQTSPATTVNQGGPMTIEQAEQHFEFSPEYKVSKFGDSNAQLVGAHAGVFVTKSILIGGGLYTMTNGSEGRGLTYGGVVVGWEPWSSAKVGLNLRTLVGVGRGTTTETVTLTTRDRRGAIQGTREGTRWLASDLFVAEPQIDLLVGLTKRLHLAVGGGYRFANAERAGDSRDLFSGATGTIGFRIGSAQ
jgi:hypothetical protein